MWVTVYFTAAQVCLTSDLSNQEIILIEPVWQCVVGHIEPDITLRSMNIQEQMIIKNKLHVLIVKCYKAISKSLKCLETMVRVIIHKWRTHGLVVNISKSGCHTKVTPTWWIQKFRKEQRTSCTQLPEAHSATQWRVAVAVFGVDVGPLTQQILHHLQVTLARGDVQRGPPVIVLHAQIAALKQASKHKAKSDDTKGRLWKSLDLYELACDQRSLPYSGCCPEAYRQKPKIIW